MTARELWDSMAAGNTFAMLTDRQRTYLIDLARKEQIFNTNDTTVRFKDGLIVRIRNAKTTVGAYGGGLAKKIVPGKFKTDQVYLIKFKNTGITQLASQEEIASAKRNGFDFQIMKPLKRST